MAMVKLVDKSGDEAVISDSDEKLMAYYKERGYAEASAEKPAAPAPSGDGKPADSGAL